MNHVSLTPAEIKARNERACQIIADAKAKPQAKQLAKKALAK